MNHNSIKIITMKIINIHKRRILQPKESFAILMDSLATKEDKVWPIQNWPKMKLDKGLQEGSKGGHGPIGYFVEKYKPNELIQFRFTSPKNFVGIHKFEIQSLNTNETEITHTINMETKGIGLFTWSLGIRWLHDALIEDAFDQIENHFQKEKKQTPWNIWVKTLRLFLK